jgi:hypothetical protein
MNERRCGLMTVFFVALLLAFAARAADGGDSSWQSALREMPLVGSPPQLNRTNCVAIMLDSFRSNQVVKALVFMPGATDEFYLFHRAKADLTNSTPSLLDAVNSLTNQSLIRVTFHAPLLLLHTDEDPLEPMLMVQHESTAAKLKQRKFVPHAVYRDRDWDFLQPILKKQLHMDIRPWRYKFESWHFYRHSFAEWGLTEWEAIEVTMLAGKTRCTVLRNEIVFEGDARVRATPKMDGFVP